mgnify:CR=1 FL=1
MLFRSKESKQIVFNTAPDVDSEIRIYYTGFDFNLIKNRKIIGKTSGSTSIIENVDRRTIAGDNYYELFIDTKTLVGNFQNGELVYVDVLDDNDKVRKSAKIQLNHWYGNYFVANGFQNITNEDEGKRLVYFLNKIDIK